MRSKGLEHIICVKLPMDGGPSETLTFEGIEDFQNTLALKGGV